MGKRKMVYLRFLFHFRLNVMVVLRWMTIRDDRGDRGGGGLHRGRHHRLSYYYFFVCFAFRNNPITFYFFIFSNRSKVCVPQMGKNMQNTRKRREKRREETRETNDHLVSCASRDTKNNCGLAAKPRRHNKVENNDTKKTKKSAHHPSFRFVHLFTFNRINGGQLDFRFWFLVRLVGLVTYGIYPKAH